MDAQLRQQVMINIYLQQQQCLANLAQQPEEAAKFGIQAVWTGHDWTMAFVQPTVAWPGMALANLMPQMGLAAAPMMPQFAAPMAAPLPAPIPVKLEAPFLAQPPVPIPAAAPTPAPPAPLADNERGRRLEEIRNSFDEEDMNAAVRALLRPPQKSVEAIAERPANVEKSPVETEPSVSPPQLYIEGGDSNKSTPQVSPVPDEPIPLVSIIAPAKPSAVTNRKRQSSGDSAHGSAPSIRGSGRPKRAATKGFAQFVAKVEDTSGVRRSKRIAARREPTKAKLDDQIFDRIPLLPSAWDFNRLDVSPMLTSEDKRRFGGLYKPKASVQRGNHLLSPSGSTKSINESEGEVQSSLGEELWPTELC